jgi:hypothetical protein
MVKERYHLVRFLDNAIGKQSKKGCELAFSHSSRIRPCAPAASFSGRWLSRDGTFFILSATRTGLDLFLNVDDKLGN